MRPEQPEVVEGADVEAAQLVELPSFFRAQEEELQLLRGFYIGVDKQYRQDTQ